MNRRILAAVVLALAGCSDNGDRAAATASPSQPAAVTAPQSTAPTGQSGQLQEPMPEGVEIPFAYHLRSDKIAPDNKGGSERRVVVEYLEGSPDAVADKASNAMTTAGFKLGKRGTMSNGNVRMLFRKKGYGRAIVVVTQDLAGRPKNPAAVGRVVYKWLPVVQNAPAAGTAG